MSRKLRIIVVVLVVCLLPIVRIASGQETVALPHTDLDRILQRLDRQAEQIDRLTKENLLLAEGFDELRKVSTMDVSYSFAAEQKKDYAKSFPIWQPYVEGSYRGGGIHERGELYDVRGLWTDFGVATAQDRIWRPYIEVEGRAGSLREVGQGNLFLPQLQDSESLLFADLRGLWTDAQAAEGNWGLAYRTILPSKWIVGVYGFYDLRHSELGNNFQQATFGAELLDVNWGFRVNGYVPDRAVKLAPGLNAAFLQGNNIVVRLGEERAYYGVDFEVERLLWCRCTGQTTGKLGHGSTKDNDCDKDKGGRCGPAHRLSFWLQALDVEVWGALGVFHFDNDTPGFENITGPQGRVELRLYDLPMLGDDSRLVASGQYKYDDVRGSVGTGMLTVRIAFGSGGSSGRRLSPLERRMVTPIVRDIDIIANTGLGVR